MTSPEVRQTIRLLSPDAPVYRPDPNQRRRRNGMENAMRTAERWADGMNSPHWGRKIAWAHHRDRKPLPPGIRKPAIRMAYYFLHGQEDENMAVTVSLHLPGSSDQRIVLHGLAFQNIKACGRSAKTRRPKMWRWREKFSALDDAI